MLREQRISSVLGYTRIFRLRHRTGKRSIETWRKNYKHFKEIDPCIVNVGTLDWKPKKNKLEEKETKYVNIIQGLKVDNPGYEVRQLTFIVDCLGGFSKDLPENLALLDFTKKDIDSILPGIQKIIITEANAVINNFNISTMSSLTSILFGRCGLVMS